MKIFIKNLGPFDKLKLEFPNKGLIHIYGDSGSGKSSLFTVIMWILTGQPRNGIVNIKADKKEEIYGILEYGDLIIKRSKKPEKLSVTSNEIFLEGEPASAYLDSLYGPSKLIFASCYLEQKTLHPLLHITAKDRLKLLQSLIDTNDKPEKYINVIDNRLKEITSRREELETDIKIAKKSLGKFKQEELEKIDENPEELEEERDKLKIEYNKIQKSLAIFHSLSGSLKVINDNINNLNIKNINDNIDYSYQIDEIKEIKKIKEKEHLLALEYKSQLNIRKKMENLKKELEAYTIPIFNVDEYNFEELRKNEALRDEGIKLCKKLDIEYKNDEISFMLQKLIKASEYYPTVPLRKKLETLKVKISTSPLYSLEDLKKWQLESSLLTCPNCKAGLKYNDGILHLEKDKLPEIPIALDKISSEILKVKEYNKNKESHDILLNTIPNIPEPDISKEKCDLLSELKKIIIIPEAKVTSEQIKLALERKKIEKSIAEYNISDISPQRSPEIIKKEIIDCENNIDNLNIQLNNYNIQLNNQIKYKELISSRDGIIEQLKEYENIEEKHNKYKKKIDKLTDKIHYLLEAANALEKLENLKKLQREFEEIGLEIKQAGDIKKIMVTIEYQMLSEKIANLNTTINDNLINLFEEPFTVIIKSFKDIKSTSQEKAEINLEYYLNGLEFDTVNILSGGQADRLSLALMIAFNSMSLLPFVMFDETLASLNESLREEVHNVIRECLSDKLVLIVSHNDGNGDYDEQINIRDHV